MDEHPNQNLAGLSDRQLVERFQAGNRSVLSELLSRYHSRIYRLAFSILHNEQDAEEVNQEVFLRLFQKLDSFKHESSFASWLYRVAINTAYMKLREKKGADMLPFEMLGKFMDEQAEKGSGADWSNRPDDELLTEESLKTISEAIEQLPEEFKTVLILRDIDGLSTEEVGRLLDLSPPAVKSRLHRARLFLRKRLEEFYKQLFDGG